MEDEGIVIAGLLVGLNVIDCNLGIKDEDLDQPVRTLITIFFHFKEFLAHLNKVQEELQHYPRRWCQL